MAGFDIERANQPRADEWYSGLGWEYERVNYSEYSFDLFVNRWPVEEKFRPKLYADILVEIIQDMQGKPDDPRFLGWLFTEVPHIKYLHYFMGCHAKGKHRPAVLYRIDMPRFIPWFYSWLDSSKYCQAQFGTGGYGFTMNLVVPIAAIPADIYEVFE